MPLTETGDRGDHEPPHDRRERGEPDLTGDVLLTPGQLQVCPEAVEPFENGRGCHDEPRPGIRQHDTAPDAFEERHPDLAFQAFDLLRHCRGGESEGARRGRHAATGRDGAERDYGFQINHEAKLHDPSQK